MSKSRLVSSSALRNANAALLSSNEFLAVAATSLFWDVVVATAALSFDASDLAVSSPKVKAKRAVKRSGSRNAVAAMYSKHPKALMASAVHALLSNGAVLPRYLVLLLVRENLAVERFQIKLEECFTYQREVKRMLEWRAMELESQRMMGKTGTGIQPKRDIHHQLAFETEEDITAAPAYPSTPDNTPPTPVQVDIALPTYAEIPPVSYPDPAPDTFTRRLPPPRATRSSKRARPSPVTSSTPKTRPQVYLSACSSSLRRCTGRRP
ncbi:hypothetical protein BC830DRAFT_776004 [Chytriomyces sp. MP71]|nr:hypothetical protein BC830DRAFT_776004 [Chytriomyces sp. MP71]